MKWLLVVALPPLASALLGIEIEGAFLDIGGAVMVSGFVALFAEWITVDGKAQDKAIEIVSKGERKYSPERSGRSMLLFGAVATALIAFLSQGKIVEDFTGGGALIMGGFAVGFVLGVLFAPEPADYDVQKYVDKYQREQAMKYMKDLKRKDPAMYRQELSRLKAAQLEQGGEIPPEFERDCEEMGIDGSEYQGSSLLRLL